MKRLIIFCGISAMVGVFVGQAIIQNDLISNLGSGHAVAAQASTAEAGDQNAAMRMTPEEQTNVAVYQQTNLSVVNIDTKSIQFDRFFLIQRQSEGTGSGVVLDKEGHILTNYHVVDGARTIVVALASNQNFPATIVGKDKEHDIAVLRIDAPPEDLYPVAQGSSDDLRVGQRVYAIGTPFGWDRTFSTGIISSLNRNLPSRVDGRMMESLIQTDAAMNPGNSGGPLLDTQARMIGMCVAIATKTGQNAGVGFAIPIDRIKRIVPELIQNGRVVRADIGITHVMETNNGLVIARVAPDGPAAEAGLQGFRKIVQRRRRGAVVYESETIDRSHADRILAVDGEPMRTGVRFRDKIWEYQPGNVVHLTVLRDSQEIEIPVTLGSN